MSDIKAESKNDNSIEDVPKDQSSEEKPTPTKNRRGGTKRLSTLERTAQESEAIIKTLNAPGGEMEGRRRTRSSARGLTSSLPVPSPPKKEKREPAPTRGTGRGRGRPKRQEKHNENNTDEEAANNKNEKHSEEVSSKMEVEENKESKDTETTESEDKTTDEKNPKVLVPVKKRKRRMSKTVQTRVKMRQILRQKHHHLHQNPKILLTSLLLMKIRNNLLSPVLPHSHQVPRRRTHWGIQIQAPGLF
ncbi:hypothetical protein KPH14_006495 [Odynerus spinipes]|uniref:Uncharacterized protein n=1 Tax=Odynerus spinipes TaxID=1348599 RepID=A0AAD9VS23_9HYME|nr:hypothetical protein KPH14_006495 [Odynerus spinipes]